MKNRDKKVEKYNGCEIVVTEKEFAKMTGSEISKVMESNKTFAIESTLSGRFIVKRERYYYHDNWTGCRRFFKDLESAKKEAAKETGYTITIYDYRDLEFSLTVDASGHVPA